MKHRSACARARSLAGALFRRTTNRIGAGLCILGFVFLGSACTTGKAIKTHRILPVGDSITVGYTDNPRWAAGFEFGYRGELFTLLSRSRIPVQYVGNSAEPWNGLWKVPTNQPDPDLRSFGQDRHEAYGAKATAFVAEHIGGWVRTNQPDIILMMIGINDIAAGATNEPAAAKANLRRIVQTVADTRPETHLILAETIPYTRPTPALLDLNRFIRETLVPEFARRGVRISSVCQYSNFVKEGATAGDPALYSNGYNHPNAEGYRRMARTWFREIERLTQESRNNPQPFSSLTPK